jgi:hypothetical protein
MRSREFVWSPYETLFDDSFQMDITVANSTVGFWVENAMVMVNIL